MGLHLDATMTIVLAATSSANLPNGDTDLVVQGRMITCACELNMLRTEIPSLLPPSHQLGAEALLLLQRQEST